MKFITILLLSVLCLHNLICIEATTEVDANVAEDLSLGNLWFKLVMQALKNDSKLQNRTMSSFTTNSTEYTPNSTEQFEYYFQDVVPKKTVFDKRIESLNKKLNRKPNRVFSTGASFFLNDPEFGSDSGEKSCHENDAVEKSTFRLRSKHSKQRDKYWQEKKERESIHEDPAFPKNMVQVEIVDFTPMSYFDPPTTMPSIVDEAGIRLSYLNQYKEWE